ncbi:MAG: NADH-quinone oxidoreductase subunit F [Bacillota bacterium]|nr:NADH-quinone oxidoreductase subunit F [Bacillota bacterium]REJ37401.1 MAG: NADH-quinone oxidoreductase subunit F [Bacillota bacterium]
MTKGIGEVDLTRIENYEAQGGYQALRKALKSMTPAEVHAEVKKANLRGRGGAGFPAGLKWGFLPDDGRPRYLCCNADESEPGTFNNRMLIEYNPHLLIEGILLAAYAVRAARSFIYIRGEFRKGYRVLLDAIEQARAKGYMGDRILGTDFSQEIVVHRGAGAYICGEETGLLSSLEGGRGEPRNKPPFPAVAGLYGMPTVVNNVETLCNVPFIIDRGADWFLSIGTEKSPGTKIFSVSGAVNRPGNYELPLGVTLGELIEVAGGLKPGSKLKAVQPGGASSPVLLPNNLDLPLDFDSVQQAGSILGTAGVMIFDQNVCMVRTALYYADFFSHESCGQCTPCREGTAWTARLLRKIERGEGTPEDIEILKSLRGTMSGTTICLLSDFSITFLQSVLKHFADEFEAHIHGRACLAERPREVRSA